MYTSWQKEVHAWWVDSIKLDGQMTFLLSEFNDQQFRGLSSNWVDKIAKIIGAIETFTNHASQYKFSNKQYWHVHLLILQLFVQ